MKFDGFDWDSGNRDKCRKHGVSLPEIESLFYGTPLIGPDVGNSEKEERLKAFGTTTHGRKLLGTFTLCYKAEAAYIRPSSSRYMHQKEVAYYEKEAPNTKN